MPATVPVAKASSVSVSVTARWYQIVPLANASHERARTATGWPKKNGSSRPVVVSTHQSRNSATSTAKRSPSSTGAEGRAPRGLRRTGLPLVGRLHLGPEVVPERPVQGQEAVGHPDLGHVARAGQGNRVLADDPRRGPRREQQHAV